MSNIKTHECFPTIVSSFTLELAHGNMIDYIGKKNAAETAIKQTEDDLHKIDVFKPLVHSILDNTKIVLNNQNYYHDFIEITGMWANQMGLGQTHPPHTHSNNFLSGVYYLYSSDETAPIQFFDPRPQASVLQPRNKPNRYNSSMVQFNSVEGTGYIFPSWLMHWVPTNVHERISISWNIIVRGPYGQYNSLQNANI